MMGSFVTPDVICAFVIIVYRMNVSYNGFVNILLLQLSTVKANMLNPSGAIKKVLLSKLYNGVINDPTQSF